jgi:hypothetical protein
VNDLDSIRDLARRLLAAHQRTEAYRALVNGVVAAYCQLPAETSTAILRAYWLTENDFRRKLHDAYCYERTLESWLLDEVPLALFSPLEYARTLLETHPL